MALLAGLVGRGDRAWFGVVSGGPDGAVDVEEAAVAVVVGVLALLGLAALIWEAWIRDRRPGSR